MRLYKIVGLSLLFVAVFTAVTVYAVAVEEINTSQETELASESTTEPLPNESHPDAEATQETESDDEPQPKRVKVKPGDTLALIAQDHDVTYARLFSANKDIEHPDLIEPGDTVLIPIDGEEIEPRTIPEPLEETQEPEEEATPAPAPEAAPVDSGSVWDQLAQCESGGRWSLDSTYDGGLQFHPDTWNRSKPAGYPDYAWQASREQQIEVGKRVQASGGWGQWPTCSSKLGLR